MLLHCTVARCISVVAIKLAHLLFIYHRRFVKIAIVTAVGSSIYEAHTNYACIFVCVIPFVFIFVVCFLFLFVANYYSGSFDLFTFTSNCAKRYSQKHSMCFFPTHIIFSDIFFYPRLIYIRSTLKSYVEYEKYYFDGMMFMCV